MGIFDTLFRRREKTSIVQLQHDYRANDFGENNDFWFFPAFRPTASGVSVSPDTALRTSAVYASVRVISDAVSTLPVKVFERSVDGTREEAPDHPLSSVIRESPNVWQNAVEFWDTVLQHLLLRGNFYAEIVSGKRGFVDQLIPIHPDRVQIERLQNLRMRYIVASDNSKFVLNQDQMFHIRGPLSSDMIHGMNPIEALREPVGLSVATEQHGASLFGNSARPDLAIIVPKEIKVDQQAEENIITSWMRRFKGAANAHRPWVARDGMDIKPITMHSDDAQFLETRKFQLSEIARIFRVPLFMLGDTDGSSMWGSGIEQQSIGFVTYTLRPWLVRIERAISNQLFSDPSGPFFTEFIVEGLLRGDTNSRFNAYKTALDSGWMCRNEVRRKENLNPVDGLDGFLESQNTRPLSNGDTMADGNVLMVEEDTVTKRFSLDAAHRIASKETNEIGRRAVYAADDLDRFNSWVAEYYNDNGARYMASVLAPFGSDDLISSVVECLKSAANVWIGCDDPMILSQTWKEWRTDEISSILASICNE